MKTSMRIAIVALAVGAIAFVLEVLSPPPASADIPQRANYQGFLTSAGGQPVNASLQMTFALYSVSTGGSALWTETQTVAVNNGIFNVVLGEVTPLTLPFDAQYYLGTTVGNDAEMTPRQALSSVPYAMRAGCNPGDSVVCYTGQTGTAGTGLCQKGTRTCNDQGTGWSSCVGQVIPNCGANCVNLQADLNNCGSCGVACAPLAHGIAACTAGQCGLGGCTAGFANCDGVAANGCETNVFASINNCGTCGATCIAANGTPACTGGACTVAACNAGFGNCDGNPGNGCETNTTVSPTNCGACGNVCSAANGTAACTASTCVVASCNAGCGNCDGNPGNGCETNTTVSPTNCGACGNVCSAANGTAACTASTCVVASCNAGFGNCDGNPGNGCETNLTANPSNCGACGHVCGGGTPTCSAGVCI